MSAITTQVERENLTLDKPGLGVDAADVDGFLALAGLGLIGTTSEGCNAVQDDRALRAETSVRMTPVMSVGTAENKDGDVVPPDDFPTESSEE